jgi:hypothetical protein
LACHDRQRHRRATSPRACSSANNVSLNRRPSRHRNSQTALCEAFTPLTANSASCPCRVRCGVWLTHSLMKARCGSNVRLRCSPILPSASATEPVTRYRCDHFTTDDTATPNRAAADWQLSSPVTVDHPLTQIVGKRSCHPMLPSGQHLELQTTSRGNPFRFSRSVNRSSISAGWRAPPVLVRPACV